MIRIKEIEFFNHKIFGSRTFKFSKNDGSLPDTVVIAGENGCGKTKLIEELVYLCSKEFAFHSIERTIKKCKLVLDISDEGYYTTLDDTTRVDFSEVTLVVSSNSNNDDVYSAVFSPACKSRHYRKDGYADEIYTFRCFGVYSSVDINYKPRREVSTITGETTDLALNEIRLKTSDDLAYSIIQLLVDINNQDNSIISNWFKSNKGLNCDVPTELEGLKMDRFTSAFSEIFNNTVEFSRVNDNVKVMFKKGRNEFDISNLSSGEKQIVFRGVQLLRNKESIKGSLVFIDEPEISMHPCWEKKIYNYYRKLFMDNAVQTSQLFMVTHSEHVLESALNDSDCVIIKIDKNETKNFDSSIVGLHDRPVTLAEIKYRIFDMYTVDFHIQLYGYIQEKVSHLLGKNANISETDSWLCLLPNVINKNYVNPGNNHQYNALPTYIRNCIDHPEAGYSYTETEFKQSIDFMISVI